MLPVSVVIPTYQREQVLIETIRYLLNLEPPPDEVIIVDQTVEHEAEIVQALNELQSTGRIRWLRLAHPSITHAMNVGLTQAQHDIVIFVDDDIVPGPELISAHARAHEHQIGIVAGQVLQPGEKPVTSSSTMDPFQFCSTRSRFISQFMGGNFSITRRLALELGGFDENFVHVAYRFEAEFAARAIASGQKIFFEPAASIRHLKYSHGGTRAFGHHLTTIKPSHSVGEYYYLLRSRGVSRRLFKLFGRPLRAVRTKHHMTHPWWIVPTLLGEALGFLWAVVLTIRGPRLLVNGTSAKKP